MPLITPVIFYKIDNSYEYRSYLVAFMPSIDIFLNNLMEFRVWDLLFGYGAIG